eukprot:TRINITY_DN4650_c0_g1_i1.p1 TRINITY_DN4650_c0_g1~~TRINITY_DN4650_c0_g1_i1.p1  ORF type:complete len:392 (+),score=74.19 TRINITY_DN4650_c0_g1_i1:209-1384(+)
MPHISHSFIAFHFPTKEELMYTDFFSCLLPGSSPLTLTCRGTGSVLPEEVQMKHIMSRGNEANDLALEQFEYGDGDLFNAPISADTCMMEPPTHEEQLVMEEDMALFQMSLHNDVLLLDCVENQELPKTPFTSPLPSLDSFSDTAVKNATQVKISSPSKEDSCSSTTDPPIPMPQASSYFPSLPKRAKVSEEDALTTAMMMMMGSPATLEPEKPTSFSNDKQRKMHRSLSSHELGQLNTTLATNPSFLDTSFTSLLAREKPCLNFSEFEGLDFKPPMRRVCSTGDIRWPSHLETVESSQLSSESSCLASEDKEFRIGHYTVEERKQRIHRYRMKRNERNFNRKIKYACRKSLADNQPRVRGRFAPKTQEVGKSSPKADLHLERKGKWVFVC